MILTSTSIHIHPYALHPYPLCSIPGMLQQSGRHSVIQSASHAWAMGNCGTCCIGRGKEVGMADDGRCVVHSLSWNELTMTCDRGLRYKPSCFQQHQMIFQKCLKLVGRKWFPFRRFLINGWTVHCFQSDECTPTFSLFVYWRDPFTLPCVTACEANTKWSFVSLCWPLYKPYQAFLGLPIGEAWGFPIWPFKSLKDVQNVPPGCQPKLGIAQGEPAWNRRCLRGQGFSRCRMDLNAFPAAQQKFAGFHLCILMNFVHSLNWHL